MMESKFKAIYESVRADLNESVKAQDKRATVANNIRITLIREISNELFGKEPYEL